MKNVVGIVGAAVFSAWLFWTVSDPVPCERVRRAAAPVRVAGDFLRWTGQHWLRTEDRLRLIVWSIEADQWTQGVISHQFYGNGLQCEKAPKK